MVRRCSRFVFALVAVLAIFAIYVRTSSIRLPATLVMGLVIVFPVMLVSASVIATVEVTYVRIPHPPFGLAFMRLES